jgi:hypothetical protein
MGTRVSGISSIASKRPIYQVDQAKYPPDRQTNIRKPAFIYYKILIKKKRLDETGGIPCD